VSDIGSPEPRVLEVSLTDSYMGNQKAKEVKSTTVILSCRPVDHSYHQTQVANFRDGHWDRHGSLINWTDRYSDGSDDFRQL
jgi:hypothetical protein